MSAMADHPRVGVPGAAVAGARRPCSRLPGRRSPGLLRAVRALAVCLGRLSTGKMAGLVRRRPSATCHVPRLCGRIVPSSPRKCGPTQ